MSKVPAVVATVAVLSAAGGAVAGQALHQTLPITPVAVRISASPYPSASASPSPYAVASASPYPVTVPSPVYVEIQPAPTRRTELEAKAYCTDLGYRAYPEGDTTAQDPSLQVFLDAMLALRGEYRQKAIAECMTQQGYPNG